MHDQLLFRIMFQSIPYVENIRKAHQYSQYSFVSCKAVTRKPPKDMQKIMSDFFDVFPEELPKGLPPSRIEGDFHITLKEDIKPAKRGFYRMSPSELQETKEQVNKLLD